MKKISKKAICVILVGILAVVLCWCMANRGSSGDSVLTIDHGYWNEMGADGDGTNTFTEIQTGDVVYEDSFGTFKVKSVSSKKIVISIKGGGFSERKGSGIDLNSKSLKTITIKKGESLTIDSQSMDAGVQLTFRYE